MTSLGLVLAIGLLVIACESVAPKTLPAEFSTSSFDELEAKASRPTYDDLFRNNERYVTQLVYYQAQLIQVVDAGSGRYQLRANVTKDQFLWGDTVFLRYAGPRFLENDVIEFVGTVVGLITYSAVLGNKVTVPDISIVKARLMDQAGAGKGQGEISTPVLTFRSPPTGVLTVAPTSTEMPMPTATSTPDIQAVGDGQFTLETLAWTQSWIGDQVVIGVVKNVTGTILPGVSVTLRFLNTLEHRVVDTRTASVLLTGEVGPEEMVPFVAGLPDDSDVKPWNQLEVQINVDEIAAFFGNTKVVGLQVQHIEGVSGDNNLGFAIQGGVHGVIYNGTEVTLGGSDFGQGFEVAVIGYNPEDRVVFVGNTATRIVLEPGWSADFEISVPGTLWGDPQLATRYEGRVVVRPNY